MSRIEIPEKAGFLLEPRRFKGAYGGRGSAKSISCAKALIGMAHTGRERILCTREFQSSIRDSVHRTLVDEIEVMGLAPWFEIQKTTIISKVTGSEFIFKGLRHNAQEIKSMKGVTKCWVEEAQNTSKESLEILIPTIREDNSEIWFSLNPDSEEDAVYQRFIAKKDSEANFVEMNWRDNPWFNDLLEKERLSCLARDPDAYDWIWEGQCRKISQSVIFKDRVFIEEFDTPRGVRFYHGADFGFADDPTVLIRCWIADNVLYIDEEAFGYHIPIDQTADLFNTIETAQEWPIYGDCSVPQTIDYLKRNGRFNIHPCEKWAGSVEDGINILKGFEKIVIHPRCKNMGTEARLYSWKTDRNGAIVPIPEDKHNHCWDSVRYSLNDFIKRKPRSFFEV
jgi:phage terminase large subunit